MTWTQKDTYLNYYFLNYSEIANLFLMVLFAYKSQMHPY